MALDARFLSITDAWGYYRGLLFPPSGEPGSIEQGQNVSTFGIEGLDTSGQDTDGRNLDSSGEGQDTSDGSLGAGQDRNLDESQDSGDEGLDTSGNGLDTTGGGVAEASYCNIPPFIPNTIDPRRDKVR